MYRIYTVEELAQLLFEVNAGTPIEEIEVKLDRSAGGIALKLENLSKRDPNTWNSEKTRPYIVQHSSEVWNLPQKDPDRVQQSRQRVLGYLRDNPDANRSDLAKAGLSYDLSVGYNRRINDARRDLGLEERVAGQQQTKGMKRQRILSYLREHPDAMVYDIKQDGHKWALEALKQNIDDLRREAGVVPKDYISAAKVAKELHISRTRVSQLFEKGQLDGYKSGRRLFISLPSVENRKQDTPTYSQ